MRRLPIDPMSPRPALPGSRTFGWWKSGPMTELLALPCWSIWAPRTQNFVSQRPLSA